MLQYLMLCTFLVVSQGLASTALEDYKYVPAKPGETPSCAKPNETYCEHVDNYPQELIRKLLKTAAPEIQDFAKSQYEDSPSSNTSKDVGEHVYDEQLCRVVEGRVRIRAVRNVKNEWRYAVTDDKFRYTTTQTCKNPEGPCSTMVKPEFPSRCVQKTEEHTTLVLHPSGEKLYLDKVTFNSCCTCTLNTPLN